MHVCSMQEQRHKKAALPGEACPACELASMQPDAWKQGPTVGSSNRADTLTLEDLQLAPRKVCGSRRGIHAGQHRHRFHICPSAALLRLP